MFRKLAVACAAVLSLAASARISQAQKALVYCPVGVDAAGCDRIVAALQARFPDGVDRGYDGSAGTLDLRAVDLDHYGVMVVPSLADDDSLQPYALLRSVASRLHFAINGRVAVYSGAPDQGSANRADKDAIIQNLAAWAASGHTRATSLVGLVAFLDLSAKTSDRYSWVRAVSLADVSADAEVQSIGDVTAAGRGVELLKSGGRAIAFANMAANGLHIGARAPGRTEVGALGGASSRQSVLVTYSNADGRDSGNATSGPMKSTARAGSSAASFDVSAGSGPTLTTDKPDYLPGDTVLFTGTGWAPNDSVTITIHEDPQWSNPDRTVSTVVDGNGNLSSHTFVVDQRDYGVAFTATAVGNPSGLVAQVTFTDGTIQSVTVSPGSVTVNAGSQATYSVLVKMGGNGSACSVNLAVTGLPTGASGAFDVNPSPAPGGNGDITRTLTVTTSAATPGGSTTFTVTASNAAGCNGGSQSGGGTLVVVVPNTAPVANNDTYGTNEDNALTVPANGLLGNDTDAESNPLTAVLVTGPAHGTLTLNSDGSFTYTPAANFNGSDSFTYNANDGTVNSTTAATVTVNVTAVNDAPSFTKGADQTVLEDAGAQTAAGWATAISAGPANENTQTVDFIVTNDNNALFSVQPSIDATGKLTYSPAADANGSATVTVKIHDNGGVANGGVDTSAPQTFVINVTAVNDAPSFTKGADQTVLEDATAQSVSGWATAISAGPANESSQTVSFVVTSNSNPSLFSAAPAVSSTGTLTYTPAANANGSATIKVKITDDGGTTNGGIDASAEQTFVINVTAVNDAPSFVKGADQTVNEDAGAQTVAGWATSVSAGPADEAGQALTFNVTNNTNSALFSVQPSVSPAGALTYTPAPNAFGSATITLTLSDNGGTANGGVDTSAPQTFTITVNPVNDVPSFAKGADQTVLEDAGAQNVSGWATAISAGPTNESSQVVTFIVTNDNNTLFSSQPAVDASGKLTFTTAANANGSATVTVKIHDDGGTANGGVDTSAPQTFTITVTAVNDAPSFTKGADQTVLEDAAAQTIANWATSISAGPPDESGQAVDFVVSNNNNSLFSVQPSIAANGTLTYTPAPDANGVATVTVHAHDNGGTLNGGVDVSADQTFTITVKPVNDAPSFTKGADQTKLEDAGAQTVANWATNLSKGPANESGQTLTFSLTNDNNTLFSSQPAISSAGALTYTPAANANGSATVSVVLKDDGGTADGGVDTAPTQTFTITITPVNDAPTFDLIASKTVLEDAGAQTVTNALTNKSAGPPDESISQTLTLTVTNNNNALFSTQPAIDASGTLTFTPKANANGSAVVTVKLQDDGGTANGGVDQTTKTFTIYVTPVNDAPVITSFTSPLPPNAVNTSVSASGSFDDVDLGDIPLVESHTGTINWGDGTTTAANIPSGSGTTRSFNGSHTYSAPGVYTLTATITDAAGAQATAIYQYVVVYDPNGGFVTGGGWINSPAGAYVPDPTLTGKATFGFVSKYKKGQSTPDGSTEFQFHEGNLNFKSVAYEWLVISGARAQYKGTGTINGGGNYGFILTAIDGAVNGGGGTDRFRIKIWDNNNGGAIVYDNQITSTDDAGLTTPGTLLGGGSIQIHN